MIDAERYTPEELIELVSQKIIPKIISPEGRTEAQQQIIDTLGNYVVTDERDK